MRLTTFQGSIVQCLPCFGQQLAAYGGDVAQIGMRERRQRKERRGDGQTESWARGRRRASGAPLAWLLGSAALLAGGGAIGWLVARGAVHLPLSPVLFDWPVWMEQRLVTCQGWFILGATTALMGALAGALRLLLIGHVGTGAMALQRFSGLCFGAALLDSMPLPIAAIDLGLTQSSASDLIALLDRMMLLAAGCAALHSLAGVGGAIAGYRDAATLRS